MKERTSLTNAVKGLLKLHGIFDLQPRAKGFEARFAEVRTAYESTFSSPSSIKSSSTGTETVFAWPAPDGCRYKETDQESGN